VALAALSWLGSHTIGSVRARLGGIELMRGSNGTDEATALGSTRCVGELPRRSSDALKNIHHPNGSEKIFRCKRAFFCPGEKGFGRLVQIRARSRISINSWQPAVPRDSEQKLQRKLNQPRIRPSSGRRYDAEILIVCGTAHGVGRSELSSVKEVEELGAELQAEAFVAREPCSLEYRKVKIRYSRSTKARIHTGLIAELKIGWRAKARSIEPSCEPGI
jgi:hypothetical protein